MKLESNYDIDEDKLDLYIGGMSSNTYNYSYDDWITLTYDTPTGSLLKISIEGMTRIQDERYSSYDSDTDSIEIKLRKAKVTGCDLIYHNKQKNILFSIDRDDNGNLVNIDLNNIGQFMNLILK